MVKSKIDVECFKEKRSKPVDANARCVMSEAFIPFAGSGRTYVRDVAEELMKYPTFLGFCDGNSEL